MFAACLLLQALFTGNCGGFGETGDMFFAAETGKDKDYTLYAVLTDDFKREYLRGDW